MAQLNSNSTVDDLLRWEDDSTTSSINSNPGEVSAIRQPLQEFSFIEDNSATMIQPHETNTQPVQAIGQPEEKEQLRPPIPQKRKLTLSLPSSSLLASTCVPKSPKLETPGQTRMWSPPICTICMEDLFMYDDSKPENIPQSSSSTNSVSANLKPVLCNQLCGHLFHTVCLNKWFMENKEKEVKICPYCNREMMANDTTRIFPIFGFDGAN